MNSDELSNLMKERTEYENKMKTKRLDALEQERYNDVIYLIQKYLSNEDNLIFD